MSGRKGKQRVSDHPEVSGDAPGFDSQTRGDRDSLLALAPAGNTFVSRQSNPGWASPATNTPVGNAFEEGWRQIRPDRAPQAHNSVYGQHVSDNLEAPPANVPMLAPFPGYGQGPSAPMVPRESSRTSSIARPPFPEYSHLRRGSAPAAVPSALSSAPQAGSLMMDLGYNGGSQWYPDSVRPSAPLGSDVLQVGQKGRSFPGAPGSIFEAGGQPQLGPTHLAPYSGSQFPDYDAVIGYLNIPVWRPTNWELPKDRMEDEPYVAKIYNAIIDGRYVWDQDPRYTGPFSVGRRWSDPKEIEAVSCAIVGTAKNIHKDGVLGFSFKYPTTPMHISPLDWQFTFAQRIHFVAILLARYKKYAHEVMMQRRLEELIGAIWTALRGEQAFQLWWNSLSAEDQDTVMYVHPYEGVAARQPNQAEQQQLGAEMSPAFAAAVQKIADTYGDAFIAHPRILPSLRDAAAQQQQCRAGPSGGIERLDQRLGPGERPHQADPIGVWHENLLFPSNVPSGAGLGHLGPNLGTPWQQTERQLAPSSGHGQPGGDAQTVASVVPEAVEEQGGDGDEAHGEPAEEGQDYGLGSDDFDFQEYSV